MSLEIWAIIILAVVVLFLLYDNKDKKEQISNINCRNEKEKQEINNEINELKQAVLTGEISLKTTTKKNTAATNELRAEIVKLAKDSQEKYYALQQKYFKLMRAYMVFRKKSEIDAIAEIEESIMEDYEALGSNHIMSTQYIASAMADFYTLSIRETEKHLRWMGKLSRSDKIAEVRKVSKDLINRAKLNQYAYEFVLKQLISDHPEIEYETILSKYNLDEGLLLSGNTYNDSEVVEKLNSTIVADRIILPGVGAFEDAAKKLRASGLDKVVVEEAKAGKPLLGICLGMQMLFERSFEYGEHEGLGLIGGSVRAMRDVVPEELKIPQIGWNALTFCGEKNELFKYLNEGDFVYFVHSYHATDCDESLIAVTEYGAKITAAVASGNVYGTQFHPEKSGEVGLNILRAFCEI